MSTPASSKFIKFLISLGFFASIIIFTVSIFCFLDSVRVGGKPVAASSTVPSPASGFELPSTYVTESYLLCFELSTSRDRLEQQALLRQLGKLHEDYEANYQRWIRDEGLRQPQLKPLFERAHGQAQALGQLAQGPFSQAVRTGDQAAQQRLMAELTQLFEAHRREMNAAAPQTRRPSEYLARDNPPYDGLREHLWRGAELILAMALAFGLSTLAQRSLLTQWCAAPPSAAPALPAPEASAGPGPRTGLAHALALPRAEEHGGAPGAADPPGWLTDLFHSADLVVVGVDAQGLIRLFNPAAERYAGQRQEQVLGQRWSELHAALQRDSHASGPTASGPAQTQDRIWRRSLMPLGDGSGHPMHGLAQLHFGIEPPPPPAALAKDTERPLQTPGEGGLQDLAQKLRGPLNNVLGLSALALRQRGDAAQTHALRRIQLAGRQLVHSLDASLTQTQLRSARLQLQPRPFCLHDTLDELLTSIVQQADEKQLHLNQDMSQHVVTSLVGDQPRLLEVLRLLADDSIRRSHGGEIMLRVRQIRRDAAQVELQFEIQSPGPTPGDVPLAPDAGQSEAESMAQSLVALMQGRLWREQAPDGSQRVSFTASFGLLSARQAQQLVTSVTLLPRRALVLDADPDAREILERMLGSWHWPVASAATPEAAQDALRLAHGQGQPYQTLLAAVNPDESDTLKWLARWQHDPELGAGLHLLALSTAQDDAFEARLQVPRFNQVLRKPLSPHTVLRALRQLQAQDLPWSEAAKTA